LTDFRADLGKVLEGQDGQQVISTLKELVKSEGKQRFDCDKCGSRNNVTVMDARNVLDAVKWITDQTQGKPITAEPQTSTKPIEQMTDTELITLSGMTPADWEDFRAWLKTRSN
jgi:predicted transcriptional regulator